MAYIKSLKPVVCIRNYAFLYWQFTFCYWLPETPQSKRKKTVFNKFGVTESGIDFNNAVSGNDSVNLVSNEYAYMGSGVGIIDINNDGLPGIFFSGNQVTSKLYLNTGNNHFFDVTKSAGVSNSKWCKGVSLVDINNDGYQDMYISVSVGVPSKDRKNLLSINNKNKTFSERATEYGLADTGCSTQAVFLDFDKDGDLDNVPGESFIARAQSQQHHQERFKWPLFAQRSFVFK